MSFDRKAFIRLMKQPTFTPTDCPNFLTYRDYEQYRWYARTLAPLMMVTGGAPLFVGNRQATLRGDIPCDTWMVVRYPSHRGMLRMIMNPYYNLVANRFRVKGTQRLELAFTQPRDPDSGLQRHEQVLALHVAGSNGEALFTGVRARADAAGLQVVYESESRLDFDFIRNPRGPEPRPLTYPLTIAIAGGDEPALRAFSEDEAVSELMDAQDRVSVNLYRRAGKYDYLRFGKGEG